MPNLYSSSPQMRYPSEFLTVQTSRLARRGGVKRISGNIYDEIRLAMSQRLRKVRFWLIATSGLRLTLCR